MILQLSKLRIGWTYEGLHRGVFWGYKGDTRRLDYSSYDFTVVKGFADQPCQVVRLRHAAGRRPACIGFRV